MTYHILSTTRKIPENPISKAPLFLRSIWFQLFEEHIAHAPETTKIIATQGQSDVATTYLPLTTYSQTRGRFKPRIIQSMSNYYSPFFAFAEAGVQTPALIHSSAHAAQEFYNQYDLIDLFPLYQNDAEAWEEGFQSIGFKTYTYHYSTNWHHDHIDSLDHYWSLRPKRIINTLNRKRKKIVRKGGFSIEILQPKTLTELHKALADYHNIYYNSWKPIEPYPAFIDAILTEAWQAQELRIGFIYYQEQPIAAQIWLLFNKTAYIFKLAHLSGYSNLSIGTILTASMLEKVIESDQINHIDFLTGNDTYKQDWMNHKRPLFGMVACNPKTFHGNLNVILNRLSKGQKCIQTKLNS